MPENNKHKSNMKAAIVTLEIALGSLENNEPINRKEGKIEQADSEASGAAEIRAALKALRSIESGECELAAPEFIVGRRT